MRFDEYGLLISDTSQGQGALGDSCAETSRLFLLRYYTGQLDGSEAKTLEQFFTDKGTLRHPQCIWREDDQPSDQDLPLYLSCFYINSTLALRLKRNIKNNNYRTGNGDLITPMFWAILNQDVFWLNKFLSTQALIFKLPWRFNDSTKKLEKSQSSSCDYLNYFHLLKYPRVKPKFKATNSDILSKITSYYKPEPDSHWLIELYKASF